MADKSFDSFSQLSPRLVKHLQEKMSIEAPTKIQTKSFPVLLSGKDALIRSKTGSGKTLAYAIPLINALSKQKFDRKSGLKALILAPTRELCLQIFSVFQKALGAFIWIVPGVLMGGEKKKSEKARIRKGLNIIISTPGRFLDHLNNTARLESKGLSWLVLDEADRLLDLGFEQKIREIIAFLDKEKSKSERQNVLVSATLTKNIRKVADFALNDPEYVAIESKGSESDHLNKDQPKETFFINQEEELEIKDFKIPKNIDQLWIQVAESKKLANLVSLLSVYSAQKSANKIIIFVSTCSEVDFYYNLFARLENFYTLIQKKPLSFLQLHGDMSQKERTSVFLKYIKAPRAVLICTDIAARGLDLPFVDFIVQFNAPISPIEYIHRIGRTARLKKSGTAVIFLMPSEVKFIEILSNQRNDIKKLNSVSLMKDFGDILKSKKFFRKNQRTENLPKITEEFLQTKIYSIVSEEEMKEKAQEAFFSFIKSYATFPKSLKYIFHPKHLKNALVAKSFGLKDLKEVKMARKKILKGSAEFGWKKRKANDGKSVNNKKNKKNEERDFLHKETGKVIDYGQVLSKKAKFESGEFSAC